MSKDELCKIAEADDLHISPFREDGLTYGTPMWIWSVAVDDALYVRGYNGQSSRWYQAAVRQEEGRVIPAGLTKDVTFVPVNGPINGRIDHAVLSNNSNDEGAVECWYELRATCADVSADDGGGLGPAASADRH